MGVIAVGRVFYERVIWEVVRHEQLENIALVRWPQHVSKRTRAHRGKPAVHQEMHYLMQMRSMARDFLGADKLVDPHAFIYRSLSMYAGHINQF